MKFRKGQRVVLVNGSGLGGIKSGDVFTVVDINPHTPPWGGSDYIFLKLAGRNQWFRAIRFEPLEMEDNI